MRSRRLITGALIALLAIPWLAGCSAQRYRKAVDRTAYGLIRETRMKVLTNAEPFTISAAERTLRARLLVGQQLAYSAPASLGTQHLRPIAHWPNDDYLHSLGAVDPEPAWATNATRQIRLGLTDALQAAARNSREYQGEKERVFQTALDLDLERDQFRATFAGLVQGNYDHDRTALRSAGGEIRESLGSAVRLDAAQRLKQGTQLSLRLGWDLLRLLLPERFTSRSLFGDASISIPLLRGAGRHIVAEPLTQAERDLDYAIHGFERFKGVFAVGIASAYLSVLQSSNEVKNAAENYRGLVASTRRARRLLDAGNLPAIQVDQAIQEELRARNRWVNARGSFASVSDEFKVRLGLPADARVALDARDLEQLAVQARGIARTGRLIDQDSQVPPADAPITLREPGDEDAGPFEFEPEIAIALALTNRLDLRVVQGTVYDAQRRVVVAANALKSELTLFGTARLAGERLDDLRPDFGDYNALLNFEPPLERTAEAIAYRNSYIVLEQAVRDLQALEDEIKLQVRDRLRSLREARETLRIQALAVELARRRVRGADLNLQAGRVEMRDLLEAQEDLLSALNAFTAATVDYRVAELELQRDLGVLQVNERGLWTEFNPAQLK